MRLVKKDVFFNKEPGWLLAVALLIVGSGSEGIEARVYWELITRLPPRRCGYLLHRQTG
jgi:hypothetical protein